MLLPILKNCRVYPSPKLRFQKREYYDNIPFPSYSPNTVNQTVEQNGYTFKGNPGQGWSVQQTPDQKQAAQQQQAAQQLYQQQQGSAISGLQTQKTGLADQYKSLLDTVNQQYQPLINQATTQENNFLGQRGLVSQTGAGGNQMSQALQGIYGQEAGNAQQIGMGSVADTNTLAQAIAIAQQNGAQVGAQIPLQYGSLAMAQQLLPSQVFQNYAQGSAAQMIPIPGVGVWNSATGKIISSTGLSSSGRTIVGNY